MKKLIINDNARKSMAKVVCCAALLILLGSASSYAASPASNVTSQETLRLGERIYREGVLPSGESLRASVKGGIAVPGTTFACVSCHLRSGLGSFDEGVYTPPANSEKIFRPLPRIHKGIEQGANSSLAPVRPAYSDETLIDLIRNGRVPNGRVLSEAMPRYILEDSDARLLVAYIKSLSSQFSPGVSDTNISFATVITEDVRPEERDAMLVVLERYFNLKNNQAIAFRNPRWATSRLMVENMLASKELALKTITLSRWMLKGPPETWRSQLEEYNRKEPVFALLGGISNGDWKPIHQFSEDNRIPCLFPNTDLPVISNTDWYTLYLSKGYYQEGESAARYLSRQDERIAGKPVIQIIRDSPEGQALSTGFLKTWHELGNQDPVNVTLPAGKILSKDILDQVLSREKPAVLVIWDDFSALPALELLPENKGRPEMVFISSRYLGKNIWALKEDIRDFTYLTYPFAFSPTAPRSAMGAQKVTNDLKMTLRQAEIPLKNEVQKIESLTDSLTQLLTKLLMDMKGNYYRDNFLDVSGMMTDQQYPLYGRINFSTDRRYASQGCFIVQLSKGDTPELRKISDWEIQ